MNTYSVFLGLGSNIGDRLNYLNSAVRELNLVQDSKVIWTSPVYETDPYGKPDQDRFFNAAVEMETSLLPPALYEQLKAIEKRLGRSSSERWGPREIDIDVLMYDGLVFEDAKIRVPHADLENRKFVLVPLREIAPDLVHPVNGMTISELATACRDTTRVVRTSHVIRL